MFNRILFIVLFSLFGISVTDAQDKNLAISYEESLDLLKANNKGIQIARKEVEIMQTEHSRLNSFWYPNLSASGAYMHLSNKIEVKEPLSTVTNPAKDFIHAILPDDQIISSILDKIGSYSLTFPLMNQDLTSIDANLVWPLFTGGKRIYAGKIGRSMVEIARYNEQQVTALSQVALVDSYYALRLGRQVVEVRKETFGAFTKQYEDALSLERNGMINKADRLVVEVAMKEALREYEAAQKAYAVAQQAFKSLLAIDTVAFVDPTSPLFIIDSIPSVLYFKSVLPGANYLVKQIGEQERVAKYEGNIAKGSYAPNIALIGKQNIYMHGVSKYLMPRTMIGVGFTWNIFDGFDREKRIRQSRMKEITLSLGKEKTVSDLLVAVDQQYTRLQVALDDVAALKSTIELSRELLRMRQKGFAEGMATATEVTDAQVVLSKVRLASLLAYYQFDSSLMTLLSLCGIPEEFVALKEQGKAERFIIE